MKKASNFNLTDDARAAIKGLAEAFKTSAQTKHRDPWEGLKEEDIIDLIDLPCDVATLEAVKGLAFLRRQHSGKRLRIRPDSDPWKNGPRVSLQMRQQKARRRRKEILRLAESIDPDKVRSATDIADELSYEPIFKKGRYKCGNSTLRTDLIALGYPKKSKNAL